jgi:hypothetical protein
MVPISSRGLDGVDRDTGLYHRAVGRPICTGDVFELTTDDPSKYPLPSMDLLDMQWKLQRVVGMKGAAEAIDLTDEGSSESYNGAEWTSMEEMASQDNIFSKLHGLSCQPPIIYMAKWVFDGETLSY